MYSHIAQEIFYSSVSKICNSLMWSLEYRELTADRAFLWFLKGSRLRESPVSCYSQGVEV